LRFAGRGFPEAERLPEIEDQRPSGSAACVALERKSATCVALERKSATCVALERNTSVALSEPWSKTLRL
jgi:hypothetical protein